MSEQLAKGNEATFQAATLEAVLLGGDLERLSPAERVAYYKSTCESLGLNPLTKPFQYLKLNGKTILYASKDCTEQLRSIRKVSVNIVAREAVEGCYVVTARAKLPDGREDESVGAVNIDGLKGEARSNALMRCETKAKRRVTLSICGLGMLDESEVDSIPGAQRVTFETPSAVKLVEAGVPAAPKPAVEVEAAPKQDTGEAATAEELSALRVAIGEAKWTKAKGNGFFKLYFGTTFAALTREQVASAMELVKASMVPDEDKTFEEVYMQLKAEGKVL